MSNEKDNGGPAFPTRTRRIDASEGMTLRDYFAAKAMHGIVSNPDDDWGSPYDVCDKAYKYADAMLKAREQ